MDTKYAVNRWLINSTKTVQHIIYSRRSINPKSIIQGNKKILKNIQHAFLKI